MKNVNKFIENVNNIISNGIDCELKIEEEVEKLEEIKNIDKSIIDKILFIFENNPKFDFGMPGMLTHYLETFYKNGYENKLVKSIQRKPTIHTLWMFNRLINGSNKKVKSSLLNELDKISKNTVLTKDIRKVALDFYYSHKYNN